MNGSRPKVLICGMGGLGCPVSMILARRGGIDLRLVDDDDVSTSNLHRQVLFEPCDVGKSKVDVAKRTLERDFPSTQIEAVNARVLPENAIELLRGVDLVVEGSDNFPTKFMVADSARLASIPVVHGSAIRWRGTALFVSARGAPCYRCLFEDLPGGDAAPNCAEAGVIGPVVGITGAFMADLALSALAGTLDGGTLVTIDGKTGRIRRTRFHAREKCSLCGAESAIRGIERERYTEYSARSEP